MRRTRAHPPAARVVLLLTVLSTGLAAWASTAPMVVAASGICLALVIALLWRSDDPPILFVAALFQWSEVALWPLATIWKQVPLTALSPFGADLARAAFYGLAAIAALAIGLRLGAGRARGMSLMVRLRAEVLRWRFHDVVRVACAAMVVGYVCAMLAGSAGPARELLNQASNIKYVGLFALAYWCLARGRHLWLLAVAMAFEVALGMTGFFAGFKNAVLTLLVATLAARPRLRPSDILAVSAAASLVLGVGIFWSIIKADFRALLNQGTGAQVTLVPMSDRLTYLARAAQSVDGARLADGFDRLVARHGYIEFLGLTLANVPRNVPHEGGRLTRAVLAHMAAPRFLFPDKPPLPSDTEVMVTYTGLPARWNEDTSISIGYLGELYVDFGFAGGLLATGVMGWLIGFVYRALRGYGPAPALLTAGFGLMAALPVAHFGTAYIKLTGAFVFSSAIALLVQRYVLTRLLPILLRRSDVGARRPRAGARHG